MPTAEWRTIEEETGVKIRNTALAGILVIEPRVFRDDRGFFLETFRADVLRQAGLGVEFVQDNHSRSVRNTIRGLHFQAAPGQAKLVRCARGAVFDVSVDLRKSSKTFGRVFTTELSDENHRQLYIPVGFAHGFCVISDVADFVYRCANYYDPKTERGIAWDSSGLSIPWPTRSPILSERDRSLPSFSEYPGPWFA